MRTAASFTRPTHALADSRQDLVGAQRLGPSSARREQVCQQEVKPAEVGDDDVGAGGDEAVAFPGVDALAADFVAGHGDGDAAGALDLLDLDEAVAEAEQLVAPQVVVAQ